MTSFDAVGTLGLIDFSPDGLQFAYSYDNGEKGALNIVDIRTSEILEQLPGASRTSWSPDGKLLAYLSSEFIIRNMESGNETKVKGDCVPGGNTMAWSPDSRFLAFNSLHVGGSLGYTWSPELFRDARICIIDSHTGETRYLFPDEFDILKMSHLAKKMMN